MKPEAHRTQVASFRANGRLQIGIYLSVKNAMFSVAWQQNRDIIWTLLL